MTGPHGTVGGGEASASARTVAAPKGGVASRGRKGGVASRGRLDWGTWPRYDAAVLGFENYWYPVMWSADLERPKSVTLLGRKIMLHRSGGKVYALQDRCPHRGVPLSFGTEEFDCTISCPYHGWTFDLATGQLVAAITDGPESPIRGRASVRTYRVEERLGLIWVFVGEGAPPPVEEDIPEELVGRPLLLGGRVSPSRSGNWRLAAENGFDEGHAKYLHRNAVMVMFREMPVWNETKVVKDGKWITRVQAASHFASYFPDLGTWPKRQWWKSPKGLTGILPKTYKDPVIQGLGIPSKVAIRMPGCLRVAYDGFLHYEWYVPEDEGRHRYIQIAVGYPKGWRVVDFWLRYWLFLRPWFHGQFTGQDAWMVHVMAAPPERLYRPDVSITEWRKLCDAEPRNATVPKPFGGQEKPGER
jgi:nitrite reductase/ring-hydroxylating ferredoxin subunit